MHEIHIDSKLIHNDFPNTMEIEKVEKLLVNLDHKEEYILYIRNLKKWVNHGLFFQKVHRFIKFNKNVWLKRYIDMNTELEKDKNDFEKKNSFMNNAVFWKPWKVWESTKISNF